MEKLRALIFFVPVCLAIGCGSNQKGDEPPAMPRGAAAAVSPSNYQPTTEDVLKSLDAQPYPGAKMAAQEKLEDKSISPDESRYRLTLSTPDPLPKVQAYYEKSLGEKAATTPTGANIFAHSSHGNDYKVLLSTEGGKTKIVETIIVYRH